MFGIVKPALEGDKSEPVVEAVEEVAEASEATIAVEPAATESTVEVSEFEVLTPEE